MIYWSLLPGNFRIEGGRPPAGFWPMMYFSLEVMTTLGLGDYAPEPTWLRLVVTIEALIGFGVLTASVSSIVLLHPALGRMRTLARQISMLARVEKEFGIPSERTLEMLAFAIARTRVDLGTSADNLLLQRC